MTLRLVPDPITIPQSPAHPGCTRMLVDYTEGLTATVEMTITGGWTDAATPTLSHWKARFSCVRRDIDDDTVMETWPVATMGLTVVNPTHGNPLNDLTFTDQDSGELGATLFTETTGERLPAFAAIVDDDFTPVLLIDTYEVEDGWRGTDLTPVLALRALSGFVHLGIDAVALCAAPIAEDMDNNERDRVAARIGAMWSKAGFLPVATANTDGLDGLTMAALYDHYTVEDLMVEIVGDDEMLTVAAGR